jgi:hypothetical protein
MPVPSGTGPAGFMPFLAVAVLAAVALLTAACGGGSPSAAGSSGAGQGLLAQAVAFAHCMRSHGVPNFSDPELNSSGGLVKKPLLESTLNGPPSARAACAHLMPKRGLLPTQAQQEQHQRQQLAFAACMRRDGFPSFPDGWSGNVGQLISAHIDPNSPQLNAALTKCGF